MDHEPYGARAIAAEMPALAVLDDIVEVELLFALALAFRPFRFRLFLFRRIKVFDDLLDQRIIVGKLGRSLGECVAGDGDEPLAITIGFDAHSTISARNLLLAMNLCAAALAYDAQAFTARRDLDIGLRALDEIARRRF